ncbi:MAG: GNAT family N-acetyltransferase [Pseudomonadota bacterium]
MPVHSGVEIRRVEQGDLTEFDAHFARHRQESGRGDIHFMPFAPDAPEAPQGLDPVRLQLPPDRPGWQCCWGAWRIDAAQQPRQIIGHVNLKAGMLRTRQHRVLLGMGIEQAFRGQGLGRDLLATAIQFCQRVPHLRWLDLQVFAHTLPALRLYHTLGFV